MSGEAQLLSNMFAVSSLRKDETSSQTAKAQIHMGLCSHHLLIIASPGHLLSSMPSRPQIIEDLVSLFQNLEE